jgi:tetratricopeptide (TPR) repeat protein
MSRESLIARRLRRLLWPVGGSLLLTLSASLPAACQSPDAARAATQTADPWDAALSRGRLDEAERLLRGALNGPDAVVARARLGELLLLRGRPDSARAWFTAAVGAYQRNSRLSSRELAAVAASLRALGAGDPSYYRDALRVYDQAIAADSANYDARVALGDLFLEKHNRPDAVAMYAGVIAAEPRHPGALLGRARVAMADGSGEGVELVRQALAADPDYVPARVVLGASHLDREAYPEAEAEARKALEINPASLPALTVLAASHLLRGDTAAYETTRQAVFQLNPRYATFYAELAEIQARNRFYQQAAEYAARGLELDSSDARVLTALGMNQLRIGRMAEGRVRLERAFSIDPFNVWVKNTLDLLDATRNYRELRSSRFRYYVDPSEADLLAPYLIELSEAAYDTFATRFGYRAPVPLRVEVYRRHADFSVRTVGLAGLGALGVSFGPVVAIDAPSARPTGDFNFGSTLWHELAHTFTLGATDHRIPRWFSEGLSVYEERRARSGWGQGVRLGFLAALKQNRLVPVSRLNDGFVRPAYPEQILHSYYQASLVCDMIEQTRGPAALRGMLEGYRSGLGTADVFRRTLRVEPEAFDQEFDTWIRKRFVRQLEAIGGGERDGPFQRELTAALAFLRSGDTTSAVGKFEQARELFPEYAERDNPYRHLAEIFRARGDLRRAAQELGRLTALAESDFEANFAEAEVREQLGDGAGAAAALERAAWIDPRHAGLHDRLATLYAGLGDWKKVARERMAVLALNPVDQAEARYQLALAWFQAGDMAAARREVLRALEIAPAFEKAQELLLRIPR